MSNENKPPERRRKRRWADAAPPAAPTKKQEVNGNANAAVLALKQSVAARLAAARAAKAAKSKGATSAAAAAASAAVPATTVKQEDVITTTTATALPLRKKAKHYELDLSITTPIVKPPTLPVKKINPYLAHLEPTTTTTTDAAKPSDESDLLMDNRLAGGHMSKDAKRTLRKELKFVEPGTYIHRGERRRAKVENAHKSGFMSGRKQGMFVKATGMGMGRSNDEDGDGEGKDGGGGDGDTSYYGASKEAETTITIIDSAKVPRADCPVESVRGSTKESGGVVVIPMPLVMEWWDVELLPKSTRKQVVEKEGSSVQALAKKRLLLLKKEQTEDECVEATEQEVQDQTELNALYDKCYSTANLSNSRTCKLIQHPKTVIPPNAKRTTATPTLYLTKKEQKRQRKLRRQEQLREQQDLQAAGLIAPPEARLTLSNFMKVLGDQAVLDPSQMEQKVMEQMQARRLKHEDHNLKNKLTKDQVRVKKERRLAEDTSEQVSVALFWVKDMSHRYHRTKVDLNAQQSNITGGVLECERPKLSLVICEGGPKAIKRYTRLMTVRMDWTGETVGDDSDNESGGEETKEGDGGEEGATQKFNPKNSCELVWTGMAVKRMFNSFLFQSCSTSEKARQVLEAKGVAHFFDQVLVHANGSGDDFKFNLVK